MSNVSTEQKLRLVQQVRSRYSEDQLDLTNRERILYGRSSFRSAEGPWAEQYPYPEDAPRPSLFKIRLLLALVLFGAVIAMDTSGINVAGITAETIFEAISVDYEDTIDQWIDAAGGL
ncbi:MAG: hypothetical protein K2G28_03995 [Acetatifactor sp.]|nr:hypothetical protein [Acetatifactor sp.]MDE7352895.1 hypothetical protein [Acetatifactor sp.]